MATPSLYQQLPWQQLQSQANAFQGAGQSPQAALAALGPQYAQAYQGALGLNAAVYEGGQTGYEGLRSGVDQQYQDIASGYQDLYGDVLGRIAGSNASNITDINAAARAQSGRASQEMVSRGLGNSTVQQNMQRAVAADRARAQTQSEGQFAQLGASYASQIGMQGLQARQQGVQTGASLGQAQLAQLERVSSPYPDAGLYTQLAQMYGQGQQAQQDNRTSAEKLGMWGGGGSNYTVGPSAGFQPKPSGYDYYGSGGGGGYASGGVSSYGGGGYSPQPYQPSAELGFSGGGYQADPYLGNAALGGAGILAGQGQYFDPYSFVGAGDGSSWGEGDYGGGDW